MARTKRLTARQVVDKCNHLAREFYKDRGYAVPKGYRFDEASHPEERALWHQARIAFIELTGTDPEDAVSELEDEDGT